MHNTDHLFTADFESGAGGDGSGCRQAQPSYCRERLFSHEVTGGEKRDGSFLPGRGNHGDLCAPRLEIKNRVRGISLRKEGLLRRQLEDLSTEAGARQEGGGIEFWLFKLNHGRASLPWGPLPGRILLRMTACRRTRLKCHLVTKAGSPSAWNRRLHTITLALCARLYAQWEAFCSILHNLLARNSSNLGFRDSEGAPKEARPRRQPARK